MIEIRQINFFEYLSLYYVKFPISLEFFGEKILSCKNSDVILLASDHDLPLGMAFACLEFSEKLSVYFISVSPNINCGAIESLLLEGCVFKARENGVCIIEYHRFFPIEKYFPLALDEVSRKFIPLNHVFSYLIPMSQNNLLLMREFWQEHGKKVLHRLNHRGYVLRQMSETDKKVMENLYSHIGNGFQKNFDPRMCSNISESLSSIALLNNEPVAFCIVSLDPKKREIRIEQLSEKDGYRKKGIFLMFLYHIYKLCVKENFKYISYQINTCNKTMLGLQEHSLNFMECIKNDYCVYRYILPQNKK